jgi:hypothetical protein
MNPTLKLMEQHTAIDTKSLLEMIEQETKTPGPKVTIFLSVPQSSEFAIIARAELKGHIHNVAGRLQKLGTPTEVSREILDKLRFIAGSKETWSKRSESYAIFASSSILRSYGLPVRVRDGVWVDDDFHITPLLSLFSLPEHYYLLDVSLGAPRMVRVHPQFTVPIPLKKVWALEVVQSNEQPIHNRSFHTASGTDATGTHRGMIPDGGGRDSDFLKKEHFLKLLAETVDESLANMRAPLVLTGTSELVAHVHKHLRYRNILVSPERIPIPYADPIALDTTAWRSCAHLFSNREEQHSTAESNLEELRAQGRVTEDIAKILSLSEAGGVMTILVNEEAMTRSDFGPSDHDLINAAVVRTLRHHGTALKSTFLCSTSGVAALLRPGAVW